MAEWNIEFGPAQMEEPRKDPKVDITFEPAIIHEEKRSQLPVYLGLGALVFFGLRKWGKK